MAESIVVFSDLIDDSISFLLLTLPRMFGFFTGFPLLGQSLISSLMIRVACAVCFSVFLHPILVVQISDFSETDFGLYMVIKEFLIGFISGFIITIPLWIGLCIGDIVESQRGGMATDNADPFTGVQSSAYGALIVSSVFLIMMMYGGFYHILTFLYKSYTIWEVNSFIPVFNQRKINGILMYVNLLFDNIVLLAAPMLIMMFLVEFGLALVNRFSPALNVFILSMPIKSMVSLFVIWFIFSSLMSVLIDMYDPGAVSYSIVRGLLE